MPEADVEDVCRRVRAVADADGGVELALEALGPYMLTPRGSAVTEARRTAHRLLDGDPGWAGTARLLDLCVETGLFRLPVEPAG